MADLIGQFSSVALLPMLKRLLDDELRRYPAFRKQAEAERWQRNAASEARMLYTNKYQKALTAIKASETMALMISYLLDISAKLPRSYSRCNGFSQTSPRTTAAFRKSVDFSRVEEMRTPNRPAAPR
ncbi:hypothetical protein [Sinorhizobium psoraleae]|uniref:Uncharacterized protein n=1 Tax=Sinorhizobium psoraleae TaxID=520838 RepID=A0ABT4KP67_9HYPH|nr:hypothetical protein [Sinorhizobium psoraleae]MCZ4093570.1 hypothetical protein [Sinorhizobium psoraleae]